MRQGRALSVLTQMRAKFEPRMTEFMASQKSRDPFTSLTSPVIPFFRDNVRADLITGANPRGGDVIFPDLRRSPDAGPASASIFDWEIFDGAAVLLVGDSFGHGRYAPSAVQRLLSAGLRVLLGVGFADDFTDAATRHGLLTIKLSRDFLAGIADQALEGEAVTINLPGQAVTTGFGQSEHFDVDSELKGRLLEGAAASDDSAAAHMLYAAAAV